MLCEKCNRKEVKRKRVCWICERKERGKTKMDMSCRSCNNDVSVSVNKQRHHEKQGGPLCKKCCSRLHSETLKKTRGAQTPERRSEIAHYAQSKVINKSESIKKQWHTIKSDPSYFSEIRKRHRERSEHMWQIRSLEDRDRIIKALTKNTTRSIGSDNLKNLLIEQELYSGFVSEEVFCGFIPDEINHDIKLIIEYYGDVYHCNPRKYIDPNQYIPLTQRTVQQQWVRDRRKLAAFYKQGYTVLIVWESDFKNDPMREIERIRYEISKKRESV